MVAIYRKRKTNMLRNIMPAIVWEKTLDDAVTRAKAEGKPIFLDFYMIA